MLSPTIDILKKELPLELDEVELSGAMQPGLVLINIINGFCTIGVGPLQNGGVVGTVYKDVKRALFPTIAVAQHQNMIRKE